MLVSEDGNRGDGGLVVVQEAKKAGIWFDLFTFALGPSGRQQVNKNMVKALQGTRTAWRRGESGETLSRKSDPRWTVGTYTTCTE